uniref:EF-hand domain-containing protein n=2 Tax=Hemiselmis andersenii TaxID=464988 RepID=A0A6U4WBK8_HEMAN|mmetsp:Transcript_19134/g.44097  ORF Transcript_19134/g.44097 Transcript_19134/m.44097 type:complete len:205 (-) Transcript_19134:15-629(-)
MAAAAMAGKQAKKRHDAQLKIKENEMYLTTLMKDFDKSADGRLDKSELGDLLQQVNKGVRPTEEEITWVFNVADSSEGPEDNTISMSELKVAITSWKTYMDNKPAIDSVFEKYDQDKTGKLEFHDLKNMLKDLNDGHEPQDNEVWEVMQKATGKGTNGQAFDYSETSAEGVGRMEVLYAITVWYAQEDQKQSEVTMSSSCCVVS